MQMNDDVTDDLALASRVAEGDQQALETLYARYADALFAFTTLRIRGRMLRTFGKIHGQQR